MFNFWCLPVVWTAWSATPGWQGDGGCQEVRGREKKKKDRLHGTRQNAAHKQNEAWLDSKQTTWKSHSHQTAEVIGQLWTCSTLGLVLPLFFWSKDLHANVSVTCLSIQSLSSAECFHNDRKAYWTAVQKMPVFKTYHRKVPGWDEQIHVKTFMLCLMAVCWFWFQTKSLHWMRPQTQ